MTDAAWSLENIVEDLSVSLSILQSGSRFRVCEVAGKVAALAK
jgi:hypothetical protein